MATKSETQKSARGRQKALPEPALDTSEGMELNQQIIGLLQQDGRMPYSTIAAQVGVSEGTVRNRVRQLLDDNVISIQAEALPDAFGYKFNAVTFIKVAAGTHVDSVAKRLSAVPEVYYLIMTLGRFDLGVATYHKSQDDFREFLTTHCYGHSDVAEIENNLVLKVHKMKLQWNLHAG
ncbi:MAG: Lrp/AsnC family transcriptional regulator [Allosphingosinicella sp.]|uniref:Lrp/AsnC family transcriptional regulator n=1 Tax=Allosphingosinicella sp. TaxID=2823234 RepID=UPI0039234DA9